MHVFIFLKVVCRTSARAWSSKGTSASMRVLKGQLSVPPPGCFNATSTDIQWQNDNGIQTALLPASRSKDFVAGEQTRGLTLYWYWDRNVSDPIEVRGLISASNILACYGSSPHGPVSLQLRVITLSTLQYEQAGTLRRPLLDAQ